MTLEPRTVDPGFSKRWSRQALELVLRAPFAWLALSAALCALTVVAVSVHGLLMLPVGFFIVMLSTEMAALSDESNVRVSTVLAAARAAAEASARLLWTQRKLLLVVAVISVGLVLSFQYLIEAMREQHPHAAPRPVGWELWLFSPHSPLAYVAAALCSGLMFQGGGGGFSSFAYPLIRAFGIPADEAFRLTDRAQRKNVMAEAFMMAMLVGAMMLAVFFSPAIAPLTLCFLPALTYVAFREVFIDGNGNKKAVTRASARVLVAGGAA